MSKDKPPTVGDEVWDRIAPLSSISVRSRPCWGASLSRPTPPTSGLPCTKRRPRQRRGVCRSRWPSSLTRDVTAPFGPLSAEEAVMRNEAAAGTRFGILCEMMATYGSEDGADFRAASYLKDWVDMGSLADCRLAS